MTTVRLLDGTEVDSTSEAWRAECEARHVAAMPTRADRASFLAGVAARRGQGAADELEAFVRRVWAARPGLSQ